MNSPSVSAAPKAPLVDKCMPYHSDKETKEPMSCIDTLSLVAKELREYQPKDFLDEDQILTIMSRINHDAARRMKILATTDESLRTEEDARESIRTSGDTYNHKYDSFTSGLVSEEFFDSIVSRIKSNNSSSDGTTAAMCRAGNGARNSHLLGTTNGLSEPEIDTLRRNLGLTVLGPGKRIKKRKLHGSDEYDQDSMEYMTNRRITRNSKHHLELHQLRIESGRIDLLLEAVIDIEKSDKALKISKTRTHKIKNRSDGTPCMTDMKTETAKTNTKLKMIAVGQKLRNDIKRNEKKPIMVSSALSTAQNKQKSLRSLPVLDKVSPHRMVVQKSTRKSESKHSKSERVGNKDIGSSYVHRKSGVSSCQDRNLFFFASQKEPDELTSPRFLNWQRNLQRSSESKLNGAASLTLQNKIRQSSLKNERVSIFDPWVNPAQPIIPLPSVDLVDSVIRSDPPRLRYPDISYGTWCSQLINLLNGAGRLFARFEFFYSDIDRAWFNCNPFQNDLAKLGMMPNVRLTRAEWSFVRRRIKKRPRRFSKSFFSSQLKDLESYRDMVRRIQRRPSDVSNVPEEFGYEVLAPITVGSTVTAYNKKAKLLHRGIVLTKGPPDSNSYLIQFERKELGCEFCPDTEISSHGVREVWIPAKCRAVDGSYIGSHSNANVKIGDLAYGTTYGTLLHFNRALDRDTLSLEPTPRNEMIPKTIESVIEREILVKLLSSIDSSLKRKGRILSVLNEFHNIMSVCDSLSIDETLEILNHPSNKNFKEQYGWLQANLLATNEAIKVSLHFLRIMYGDAYSLGSSENETERKRLRDTCGSTTKENIYTHSHLEAGWHQCMKSGIEKCGAVIAKLVHDPLQSTTFSSPEAGFEQEDDKNRLAEIMCRVAGASSLLLATELSRKALIENREDSVLANATIQNVLRESCVLLRPTAVSGVSLEFASALDARGRAYRSLSEALSMLEGELTCI